MFRHRPILIVALVFPLLGCLSRRADDPAQIVAEADRLAMLYNWPKAAQLYARAESILAKSGDTKDALYARLGYIWATADTGVNPALSIEVDRDLRDVIVQSDARLTLRVLVAKAALDRERNEASAREPWQRIRDLAKATDDKRWQARAEAELGEIAYMDGDVTAAVGMFKGALLSQLLRRDVGAAVFYLSMVGNGLVEAGEPERGLQYCNRAMQLASVSKDAGFPFLAYQGKARSLVVLHRDAEAQVALTEALAQARSQGDRSAETQLLIVAGHEAESRDTAEAVRDLKSANDLSEKGGFQHAFAWSALELAKAYRAKVDLEDAETYAVRALAAMRDLNDKYHLPQHLALLADLEARRGEFSQAESLYTQATDVINALLVNVPSAQIEGSLIGTLSEVYLGHFSLAAASPGGTAKAFEIIEDARGRSLADALRSHPERDSAPDAQTAAARHDVNRIQFALLHETDAGNRHALLDELFEAEQIAAAMPAPHTALQSAVARLEPVLLPNVQASLHADEAILEYVLDEPRSSCLLITRRRALIIALPEGRRQIEAAIDDYLGEIRAGRRSAASSQQLYRFLLQPVLRRQVAPTLIVVPDGRLNRLPFDALADPSGRLVLESRTVTYVPSSTVLCLIRHSAQTHKPALRFLGVGAVQDQDQAEVRPRRNPTAIGTVVDPFRADPIPFANITKTRDEIIEANWTLGGHGKLLLGKDATEYAFKSQPLGDFQIIHIATHGIANADYPDRAALVLASDPHSADDGLLQVREIRDLDLHADLVTLSGCETATGDIHGEEGVTNLVRAFLFAGARSVLASLWATSDIYTQNLMRHFYRHLAEGQGPARALRQAKLDLIQEFGDPATPAFWAGFVFNGDGIPLNLPRDSSSCDAPTHRSGAKAEKSR